MRRVLFSLLILPILTIDAPAQQPVTKSLAQCSAILGLVAEPLRADLANEDAPAAALEQVELMVKASAVLGRAAEERARAEGRGADYVPGILRETEALWTPRLHDNSYLETYLEWQQYCTKLGKKLGLPL